MDYRSRRLRTALLLGTAFLAGVAIGPASGLIAAISATVSASPPSRQDSGRADTYRLLTLFGDVFERVRARIRRSGHRQGPDRELRSTAC